MVSSSPSFQYTTSGSLKPKNNNFRPGAGIFAGTKHGPVRGPNRPQQTGGKSVEPPPCFTGFDMDLMMLFGDIWPTATGPKFHMPTSRLILGYGDKYTSINIRHQDMSPQWIPAVAQAVETDWWLSLACCSYPSYSNFPKDAEKTNPTLKSLK